jgi:hypothetical protein
MLKQLASSFKRSKGSRFHKAVKVKELPPKGVLPYAAYVKMGVPFMRIFEEGGSASGKGFLIILLPEGAKMGLKRISKGNPWSRVWGKIRPYAKIVRGNGGNVILAKTGKGQYVPIYKFQKAVTVPKKISFFKAAEAIAKGIPDEVSRLIDGA